MSGPRYVIDSNIFMEAANRHYAFEFGSKFWDELRKHAAGGAICTVQQVYDEIKKGKGPLLDWFKSEFTDHVHSTDDPAILQSFAETMEWVNGNSHFLPRAKEEYAASNDGWVIAFARVNRMAVVTHETFDAQIRKRVKIPNVCQQFGVHTLDTYALMRDLKIQLG